MIQRTVLNPTQVQYVVSSPSPHQEVVGRNIQLLTFTVSKVEERSIVSATYYDVDTDKFCSAGSPIHELEEIEEFDHNLLTWCYKYHSAVEENTVVILPPRVEYSDTNQRWVWHCQYCNVSGISLQKHVGKRLAQEHVEELH